MKQLKVCLLVLSAMVALVSCGSNEPSVPASPIILRPEDFLEGEASLTLERLAPDESVVVIPVYATQDFQKDTFEFSISTENISPQLPKATAQLTSQESQPYPNHSDHIAFLEESIALVSDLQRKGIPPLGRGDIQSQAFDKCPPPYTVGKQCQFWVRTRGEMARITATLQQVSPHAYWFVQNEDISDLNTEDIAQLVTSFEKITIPTDTHYFGNPPDVDGNGKTIIVFSSLLPDLLGYVFGVDLFPDGQFKGIHSNEGDIFYAATPRSVSKFMNRDEYFQAGMPSTLTHEFKHLIAFGERILQDLPLEDLWLEEPSAMAAQQLALQGSQTEQFQPYAADALATPQDFRVTHEGRPSDPAEQRSMYGYNFLFLWRLGEKFGHETFWRDLVQSPETGVANLEAQTGQSFADLMLDWSLTLLFDHTSLLPGYDYQDLDLRDGSWERLGYRSLGNREGTARSMAYYLGRGQGTDATITVRSEDAEPYVIVVRFKGTLPW